MLKNQTTDLASGTPSPQPLMEMQGVSKAFPGVQANDNISLSLQAGTIHALLGENGAGKSTLMKVLYGLLAADSGTIYWQGKPVSIHEPVIARRLGIAMIFQHFSLFESLTVLENIALGMDVAADHHLGTRIVELSKRYGLDLDPQRSVYTLSVGARQRIEIVRCLLQQPKLLIMDEPTSVLTPQEVSVLFETLRVLAREGMAILYISHKLEEIRVLCSVATVLRNGRKVAETDPRKQSVASLASLMVGEELPTASAPEKNMPGKRILVLEALSAPAADGNSIGLKNIDLHVRCGEIVGIAGVAGNGQDELLQLIAGEKLAMNARQIMLDDVVAGGLNAGQRRRLGLCAAPEQRLGHASVPGMSLIDNVFLTAHHRKHLRRFGFISYSRCKAFAKKVILEFKVQCQGPDALASSLSGGNLQKFILGREILQAPRVLVVSQPTWGVDAGAALAIHKALAELAQKGAAVLLISQDLDELLQITHRIGALCAGRLSAFYPTHEVSIQDVGLLMGGGILRTPIAGHGQDDAKDVQR